MIIGGWVVWTGAALQVLAGGLLVFPLVLEGVRQLRKRKWSLPVRVSNQEVDYAVIITAYEEVSQIPNVVESVLRSDYTNFLVYIVADNCDVSGLSFSDGRIVLLRPETHLKSNIKSHFYAIRHFKRAHTHLCIIDSDNLVHPGFLRGLIPFFYGGFSAVQGVRKAKNLNTTYACLDEAGDIYYRYSDRVLLFGAGSSSSLAGSGMAFSVDLYRDCLGKEAGDGAGFDKVLQYAILKRGYHIAFSENAIVYDEKTSRSDQLVKQRARWINTWFRFVKLGFGLIARAFRFRSFNMFAFGIMLMRPPLFLLLSASLAGLLVNLFFWPVMAVWWGICLLSFVITLFSGLRYFRADRKIYHALASLPVFFFYQVKALLKARHANRYSVATKHDNPSRLADMESSDTALSKKK